MKTFLALAPKKMRKNNRLLIMMFIAAVLPFPFNSVESPNSGGEQQLPELPQTDQPSKELVIAVLTIMFSVTFLLLVYVKFCRVTPNDTLNPNLQNLHGLTRSGSRFSGIEREVIETLPFFKFSSLKGSREGLECTVCLSRFEESEVLRLLPKCHHAFHVACIDTWLESHSTCPLCRHRVEAGDVKSLLTNSLSSGFLRVPSNLTDDPNLEIYVQREPSSQFEVELGGDSGGGGTKRKNYGHKVNHRIVVSDVVKRSRWSDLNSSDLISLSFEMLDEVSSARFSEEAENSLTAAEKRSMSEIPGVARFVGVSGVREYSGGENVGREERIWMPIARRTVQWFARRERNSSRQLRHQALGSNV